MWGVLKAGLSKVDELATQGLASATQLLEKLDGEFEEETDESLNEEIQNDNQDEDINDSETLKENVRKSLKKQNSINLVPTESLNEEVELRVGNNNVVVESNSRYETRSRRRASNSSVGSSDKSVDGDNKKASMKKKDENVQSSNENDNIIAQLQSNLTQKDAELVRMEEEHLTRFSEIGKMSSELEKLRRDATASSDTIAQLRTELTQPPVKDTSIEEESVRQLQEECALMKQQKATLVQERDKFLKKVEELTALTQERDALLPKVEELTSLKKERDMLSRKVKDLLNANTGLQSELANAAKAVDSAAQKDSETITVKDAEIQRLANEVQQLTAQLTAGTAVISSLQADMVVKDQQLFTHEMEFKRLAQLTEIAEFALQQNNEQLISELEHTKEELSSSTAALTTVRRELEAMTEELAASKLEQQILTQRSEQESIEMRTAMQKLEQELSESKEGQMTGGRRAEDKLNKKTKKLELERVEMLEQISQLQKQLQEQMQINADALVASEVKDAAPAVDPSAVILLEERVAALETERDALQGKLTKALRVQELKAEVSSIRSLQQEFRQDVEQQLGTFVQQFKETSTSLTQALSSTDTKPSADEQSIAQQSESFSKLQEKSAEFEATIASNMIEISKLQLENSELSGQLVILTSERDDLVAKTQQLEAAVGISDSSLMALRDAKSALETQLFDLNQTLKQVQSKTSKLQADNDDLSKILVEQQLASTSTEDESEALKEACAALRTKVAQLEIACREGVAASADLTALHQESDNLIQQIASLRTEAAETIERAANAEARVEQLETTLQSRVIDDAALRDANKELVAELKNAAAQVISLENKVIDLQAQVAEAESSKVSEVEGLKGHIYTLKLDLEGLNKIFLEKEKELVITKDQLSSLRNQAAGAVEGEVQIASMKQSLAAAKRRADELELAMRTLEEKAEEKKHRDLEALRHHNDLYSALQLEKLQSERVLNDANSDLTQQIEYLKTALSDLTKNFEEVELEVTALKNQLAELQMAAPSPVQHATVRRGSLKSASNDGDSPEGVTPSYVMVETEPSTQGQSDELVQCLAQLAEVRAELKSWILRAEGAEDSANSLQSDAASAQEQLKSSQMLITELQQERRRLERENQILEKTVSHSLHISGYTQRPPRGERSSSEGESDPAGDVELGDLKAELYDYWESEKKGEVGVLPVFVQLWDIMRYRSPWLLSYVGRSPPRLGMYAQIAVIYFLFLHLALWWETGKRCPLPVS